MKKITFITGSQKKADYLASFLGFPVGHVKIDLDEIQSLDLLEVVRHKVRQAYQQVGGPVLVDDTSLEFSALGKLPGPLIKWFIQELSLDGCAALLSGKEREAVARCVIGYFDGTTEKYFEGSLKGTIAEKPAGEGGFGWDRIFIPEGYTATRAELGPEDDRKTYLKIKPILELKKFLEMLS